MKRMYTTNNARNGTSGVVDVLFNMTISLASDATRNTGSGTIGTVLFSRKISADSSGCHQAMVDEAHNAYGQSAQYVLGWSPVIAYYLPKHTRNTNS